MPRFIPSRWRSISELSDEELHNDEVHGVKNETINYGINNTGSVENTEQIFP
jgi:hypothetical protein